MRAAIVSLVTTIALMTSVIAGPRKILVLPLDGNAPAEQKLQLDDAVVRMTQAKLDGDVTIGETTFFVTATAVGCDPQRPECAETVRSTLGVDELIYGSAETADGMTTVTLRRASQGAPIASQVSVIAETDSGDAAEPALEPVFGPTPVAPDGSAVDPATGLPVDPATGLPVDPATGLPVDPAAGSAAGSAAVDSPRQRSNFFDTRERKLGVGLAAGGAIALAIGVSFWSSKGGLQDQIDNHPNRTLDDLEALAALEDRAGDKALWGNIMVALGLGLGGAGAYYLYKDHQNRSTTVTPAPAEAGTGMTLIVEGRW